MVSNGIFNKDLNEIASFLNNDKKVQLVYAFNGTGKTRLSKEFKNLINANDSEEELEGKKRKILYYNAYSEDLFYWDNDLENDSEPKLKIQPNDFTSWLLKEQGESSNIVSYFQNLTGSKATPIFNSEYKLNKGTVKEKTIPENSEVSFKISEEVNISTEDNISLTDEKGNLILGSVVNNVKISKGEESNFIWSVYYSLFEQVIEILEKSEDEVTDVFNDLEYIFIDDPVSSLDENHIIQLAINLAALVKKSKDLDLKFIITTHNTLFYNVLHNELKWLNKNKKFTCLLSKNEDNTYNVEEKNGDSNTSFSYHLHIKKIIEDSIENNSLERYHFMLLRNLYEKTASFLGYKSWSDLLPDDKELYYNRVIQFSSHSTLSTESIPEPTELEKKTIEFLLKDLVDNYNFWKVKTEETH